LHISFRTKNAQWTLLRAFLVATSAGEVGVDIDADHMVCDLVAWERMVQRLGRVNRRGEFDDGSLIDVFVAVHKDKEAEMPPGTPLIATCRKPFDSGAWATRGDDRRDASPGALLRLRDSAKFKTLADEATTGEPLRPLLTRAVLDAWAMTSLESHSGRPKVEPWIRGWLDEERQPPQTQVLWRQHLPIRENEDTNQTKRALAAFFDAAPPHISEILETEAYRVVEMLPSGRGAVCCWEIIKWRRGITAPPLCIGCSSVQRIVVLAKRGESTTDVASFPENFADTLATNSECQGNPVLRFTEAVPLPYFDSVFESEVRTRPMGGNDSYVDPIHSQVPA
jgi:CRISPR-associated helicase Cas3